MNATMTALLGTGLVIGVVCFAAGVFLLILRVRGIKKLAEVPGLGEISTLNIGVSLLSVSAYCFWHAASSYLQYAHNVEMQSKFNQVLVATSQQLREEYRRGVTDKRQPPSPDRFARAALLIDIMRHLDSGNGHAHYFAGEVKRRQDRGPESHADFYRYFEVMGEARIAEDQGDTGSEVCYQMPRGYCRQRSGWMRHLLANDFYDLSRTTADPRERINRLEIALRHAEAALRDMPGGFHGLDQGQPTTTIADGAREQLGKLRP